MQGLTEGLTERQGFTEDRVWPTKQRITKAGSHRRQGGAKPSLATDMRITYDAMQGLTQ